MKNKNRIYRVAALLLVLCFISTVMISGTFAKYTSEYSGQDTALVARWSFTGFAGQNPAESTTELDFFKHLYTTHINPKNTADDTYLIAPGVEGSFVLNMDYIADVDADVLITIDPLAGNANVPVEYSVDNGATWKTLADLPEALATKIIASGKGAELSPAVDKTFRIAAVDKDSIAPVSISETVKWRWPYEASAAVYTGSTNATDTGLGEASQTAAKDDITKRTSYGIKVTLKATQVAPTTTP